MHFLFGVLFCFLFHSFATLLLLIFSLDVHACTVQMARFYAVLFSFSWNAKVMVKCGETNFICCLKDLGDNFVCL